MARFCSECGTALEAGDRFCTKCGARTSVEAPSAAVAAAATAPAAVPVAVAAMPTAPTIVTTPPPAAAAAPAMPRGGVPLRSQIVMALVWGGFAGAAGYLHDRVDGAISWGLATAVATFAVLVALSLVRTVLTAPFRRRTAVAGGGALGIGTIVFALLTGTVVGATAWVVAPELPPSALDPARFVESLTAALPLPAPAGAPLEKRVALRDPAAGGFTLPRDDDDEIAGRALAQLEGIGVGVSTVGIVEMPSGQRVMVVGVDALALGPDLGAGLDALITLAKANAFELGGVDSVAVALHDEDGRALFSMSASVSEIEAFRASGDRRQFIRDVALRTESRLGMLDAATRLAGR